jgi:16S rRNA G966 N2-methylase RsmD
MIKYIVLILTLLNASCVIAQESKVDIIYTDPPLKKGVLYVDPTISVPGILKLEEGCVYFYSKNKALAVFRDGTRLNKKQGVIIKTPSKKDLYIPFNKKINFSTGEEASIQAADKKKYNKCISKVNKIIRVYS